MVVIFGGMTFLPILEGTAQAQSGSTYYTDRKEDAVDYSLLKALEECARRGIAPVVTADKLASEVPVFTSGPIPIGHHVQRSDGSDSCSNPGWVSDALDTLGLSGKHSEFMARLYDQDGNDWYLKEGYDQFSDVSTAVINAVGQIGKTNMVSCAPRSGCNIRQIPDETRYILLMENLVRGCDAEQVTGSDEINSLDPDKKATVKIVTNEGKVEDRVFKISGQGKSITVGYGLPADGGNDGAMRCETIVSQLNGVAQAYADKAKASGQTIGDSATAAGAGRNGNGTDDGGDPCLDGAGILGWIICPIIDLVDSAITGIGGTLVEQLRVDDAQLNPAENDGLFKAWQQFRTIANVLFIGVGLIIIMSTALNIPILDAYAIKKALPRLVVAVISVQFSWLLTGTLVTATNALGDSLQWIIYSPFGGEEALGVGLSGQGALLGTGGLLFAGGFIAVQGAMAIVAPLALAIGMILLISFLVIVLREALIFFLVLVAPVAFVAGVLPNTEKMLKLWWGTFSKALLMYPLIISLIAMGKVFASIVDTGGNWRPFIALLALWAPYFMIPFTFRFAGGAIAAIGGFANDKSRGVLDKSRKKNAEKRAANVASWKTGDRFKNYRGPMGSVAGKLDRVGAGAGAGWKGRYGFGDRGAIGVDTNQRNAAADFMKSPAFQGQANNDNVLRAATYRNRAEAEAGLRNDFGYSPEDAAKHAREAEATIGYGRAQQIASAQQLVSTGTGYDNNQQMTRTLARAADGNFSTGQALAGFANAETKKVGRFDLAPGFSNLNTAVGREMSGNALSSGEYGEMLQQSWESSSTGELANMKAPQFKQYADHWLTQLETGGGPGVPAKQQAETRRKAAVALMEMQNMLPQAKGGTQEHINNTLNEVRSRVGAAATVNGGTGIDFNMPESVEDQLAYLATHSSLGAGRATDMDDNGLTGRTIRGYARVYDDRTPQGERGGGVPGNPNGGPIQ